MIFLTKEEELIIAKHRAEEAAKKSECIPVKTATIAQNLYDFDIELFNINTCFSGEDFFNDSEKNSSIKTFNKCILLAFKQGTKVKLYSSDLNYDNFWVLAGKKDYLSKEAFVFIDNPYYRKYLTNIEPYVASTKKVSKRKCKNN